MLYFVVAYCPGVGYDTSTSLISYAANPTGDHSEPLSGPLKFARWDAIYFLDIAEKGYIYEQEWAFGWGYTKLLSLFASGTSLLSIPGIVIGITDRVEQAFSSLVE